MDPETFAAPLPDHLVARVRGEAPLKFLDDTTSQDLTVCAPGRGALTCVLDEKGRVLAELRVLPLPDGSVLLDGEAACGDGLWWLARVAPLAGCAVDDESPAWTVSATRGPHATAEVVGVPAREHGFTTVEGALAVRVEWGPPGLDILSRGGTVATNAALVPASVLDAARIAAGRTRYGVDVTAEMLVNETPLIVHAVAEKGCYPGQESVARVRNLGKIRRKIAGLTIASGRAPEAGAPVVADGEAVGSVTSAGVTADGAVAIARVRAEVADGADVEVAGARATVHDLF